MNKYTGKTKDFFGSIGKMTASLFIAALGVMLVLYAFDAFQKIKNEKYETAVEWTDDLKVIGFAAKAKTKVVNGEMYVQLSFDGYPNYLKNPSFLQKNRDSEFIISFIDNDKFDLFERRIKVSQFSTRVNDNGKPIGLLYQFTAPIDTAIYAKFHTLAVAWTFDAAISDAAQNAARAPKGDNLTSSEATDHCAPGISRSERLRRLALHGPLRETSKDSYISGSRAVSFFSDGSVLLCN